MPDARNWRCLLPVVVALCLGLGAPAIASPCESGTTGSSQKSTHSKSSSGKKTSEKRKNHKGKEPKAPKTPKAKKPNSRPPVYHASDSRSDRCQSCDRDENGRIVRSDKAKQAFKNGTGYPKG